jgi:hypothetical protein
VTNPQQWVRPYETIAPPPAGGLATAYFTPLMKPTPVAWRLPQPDVTADTINGFLRVEPSGGPVRADGVLFDVGIILASYAPNNRESDAELIMTRAIAWGNNAMGTFITHPSTQQRFFVAYSRTVSIGTKQADPLVNMARFIGKIMWRMKGLPLRQPEG